MSMSTFEANENFLIRIKKQHANDPSKQWFNTYECTGIASGTLDDLVDLAMALLEFEKALHYDVVQFTALNIATWQPDSHPYSPFTFWSQALTNQHGAISAGTSQVAPREVALWLSRNPDLGRLGKIFYRCALSEADIQATSGAIQLTNPTTISTRLNNAIQSSMIHQWLFQTVTKPLVLSMVSKRDLGDGVWDVFVRFLQSITLEGTIIVKFNHKYFDRGQGAPGPSTINTTVAQSSFGYLRTKSYEEE